MMRLSIMLLSAAGALLAPAASAQVAPVSASASASEPVILGTVLTSKVDPLRMETDDFLRLRDPAVWDGLSVERLEFREDRIFWRLYRIVNTRRPSGPLWYVPHDDENAAFQAALVEVKSYGGVLLAVEEARSVAGPDARSNADVAYGRPVDPNRNFGPDSPEFTNVVLAELGNPARLMIALHTNAPGYDSSQVTCPGWPKPSGDTGSGEISVLVCNDIYTTRRSARQGWPFDDTDSNVILPYLDGRLSWSAFCSQRLGTADPNFMFERVATSDGSLSNYAVQHGLPYVNLETQDRGVDPAGLADATGRLVRMVDIVMDRCAAIDGLALRPPRVPPAAPGKIKRKKRSR